jgi:hypothetical protein
MTKDYLLEAWRAPGVETSLLVVEERPNDVPTHDDEMNKSLFGITPLHKQIDANLDTATSRLSTAHEQTRIGRPNIAQNYLPATTFETNNGVASSLFRRVDKCQ